ncbi:DNA polymerase III subunit alpha [Salinibacter ruber]|uniref:DNA polymerase III subunit alpha n=1 Tax=Salinibacter ruber TaxID=146919 RepID=UPI0021671376|nr:DNA polymerase III subunit alpha [Salinibacter ruber]MCS3782684.1 DNA polymerase-3 subunit alpha [Salinibacter ruber]
MPQYTHLHNHTSASLFDGAQTPKDLTRRIDQLGMTGAAITDHGACYGWPKFQSVCDDIGIQPVLGVESYLVVDRDEITRLREKSSVARTEMEDTIFETSYHQVLLAKTQEGLRNLMALMSWAADEGFYRKPLIDFAKLEEHAEGLIATSSCLQGFIPQIALGNGRFAGLSAEETRQKLCAAAETYLRLFGDDFYLEAHNHGIEAEETMRDVVQWLSGKYDIDVITANDCHYSEPGDHWLQKVKTCLSTSNPGDPTYFASEEAEAYSHDQLHVKGAGEMVNLFPEFPDAAQNTMEVLSKCDARLPMEQGEYFFPEFPELAPAETAHECLKKECGKGFRTRYPNPTDEHRERMRYELGVIDEMGFSNYFLIVADMIQYAKQENILVGPGRGSAAGSMVTYCLGITNLDPLKHDLLFSRFLNPARVTMPDIDIDFDDNRRDEVFDYLYRKYGEDRVAKTITFSKYKTKGAMRDVGKIFQMEQSEVDQMAKQVPDDVSTDPIDEVLEESPELRKLERNDDRVEKTFEALRNIYGMESHTGKHAAAAVVTPGQLTDHLPTDRDDGETITQFDGDQLEELGLLKIDVLGLKTLRTIEVANRIVDKRTGERVPQGRLERRDDPAVYEEVFSAGDTTGIFQFGSDGMQEVLQEMEPSEFGHIVTMNALYRPGPMDLLPEYIARMQGEEPVVYLGDSVHDEVKGDVADVLEDTYGIMVFQEQVMQVCQRLAGFTLEEADVMRRAISKKNEGLLGEQRETFVEGCAQEGYSLTVGRKVFDLIEAFSGYAFCRAHATAYAAIAYQQAYFKAHYPTAFFTAALRTEDSEDKQVDLIQNAEADSIEVLAPSVNESGQQFTATEGEEEICFGLSTIKNVGKEAQKIIGERESGGPYESFMDLCTRAIPNLRAVKSLIKAGAMDCFRLSRKAMYEQKDAVMTYARKMRNYRNGDRVTNPEKPSLEDKPEWPRKMRFQQERDVAGIYTSGNPIEQFPELVELYDGETWRRNHPRYGASDFKVRCGSILSVSEATTRSGNPMWWVRYLSTDGIREEPVFQWRFEAIRDSLEKDVAAVVVTKADVSGDYAGMYSVENVVPMRKMENDGEVSNRAGPSDISVPR